MTNTVRAIGATAEASPLEAIDIVRRTPEANDVRI
jgi:hypothetical protein